MRFLLRALDFREFAVVAHGLVSCVCVFSCNCCSRACVCSCVRASRAFVLIVIGFLVRAFFSCDCVFLVRLICFSCVYSRNTCKTIANRRTPAQHSQNARATPARHPRNTRTTPAQHSHSSNKTPGCPPPTQCWNILGHRHPQPCPTIANHLQQHQNNFKTIQHAT